PEETVEQVQQIHNDKVDAIKEALKELSPPYEKDLTNKPAMYYSINWQVYRKRWQYENG
ncbi:hypothetical protein MBAV_003340, partial [Candidatus Magnetobacterium bavaricum]